MEEQKTFTDDQRNAEVAKMLGWFPEDSSNRCWVTRGEKGALNVQFQEDEIYPHTGLPFNRDWHFLMDYAVAFIEKQNGTLLGGEVSMVRLSMVKTIDTNENRTCFMFNQVDYFTHLHKDKKRCLFLSVSDFAKAYNEDKSSKK